jgi:drug/metabolite transporter (DMT)-like permease
MPSERQIVARATAFIILSSCGFGSLSTLTVLTTRAGLSLVPAMFWRYFIAAAALLLFLRNKTWQGVERKRAIRLMIVGGFGQAVITYLSLRALDYLPVGPLAFLFYTYPAWVALISAVFGREELTLIRIIALSIAMGGIVVMVGTPASSSLSTIGVMLALGTALLYAFYLPALQHVQHNVPPAVSSFYLIIGVFATFFVASIFRGELQLPHSVELWRYLILLALLSTVIAFAALISGLRVLGPVRTSIIATIEPFFTAMLGVVLLGQPLSRNTVSGGVLIAGAVILLQFTGKNSVKEKVAA